MSDMNEMRTSQLWGLACQFARRMFDIGNRNPFASDRFLRERIRAAALQLTARVFESYETTNQGLRSLHLVAAAESAQELRHYLSLADRTTAIPPLLLDEAHSLAEDLEGVLSYASDTDALAWPA